MAYEFITLQRVINIERIVSIHYFEYMSDFTFPGESHNFWEFVCVDKGEIDVVADVNRITMKKGDIIFHKPNEFHNVITNGRIAPNLVVISFECTSPYMRFFENKQLVINENERNLLAQIIIEARNSFSYRLDNPYQEKLERNSPIPAFGSDQLIAHYLEQLLIHLYRRYSNTSPPPMDTAIRQKINTEVYNRILTYLSANVNIPLTIEKICRDNLIGRSQLQKLFHEKLDCGVIDYFSRLKIDAAKQLIRENQLNFTQISDALGYSTIHYFSRQFKKITGMSPSEYSSSIKSLSEAAFPTNKLH